uniref:Uncharacterized protein n=1 Tax=Cacopsylla melanoneura TaxID=428564 RepID=A0A8D8LS92_9HEMI
MRFSFSPLTDSLASRDSCASFSLASFVFDISLSSSSFSLLSVSMEATCATFSSSTDFKKAFNSVMVSRSIFAAFNSVWSFSFSCFNSSIVFFSPLSLSFACLLNFSFSCFKVSTVFFKAVSLFTKLSSFFSNLSLSTSISFI